MMETAAACKVVTLCHRFLDLVIFAYHRTVELLASVDEVHPQERTDISVAGACWPTETPPPTSDA